MKNFNGRPFFSLFFIARANQKIPNLALGRESIQNTHNALLAEHNVGEHGWKKELPDMTMRWGPGPEARAYNRGVVRISRFKRFRAA
jgi:hypothetical protein